MTDEQNQDRNKDKQSTEKHRDRTIGRGMDSPDSTQMPLRASDGEPDMRTQKKKGDKREDETESEGGE
ncbi:MAG: hypothetical protein M3081_10660 [Gemmatimonadota bacterium]|nr:hypothetical protein [Gemmatimonadota bacterium]